MRAITLTQPWATLVAIGAKKIETRSWPTSYRGRVLIHAGKYRSDFTIDDCRALCDREPFHATLLAAGIDCADDLPTGAIVAVTEIIRCETFADGMKLDALECAFGEFTPGRYGFHLGAVVQLKEPVPTRGMMGLWEPSPAVVAAIFREITGAGG